MMLEKQHDVSQKAFDKIQKTCDELLRERDAVHKELKKAESMFHREMLEFCLEN